MRFEKVTLDVKGSVATGTASIVRPLIDKWVHISGTFVADLDLQISLDDGTTWHTLATVTAPAIQEVPQAATHLRFDTTSYSSGTPVAKLTGRDVQPGS